jgi:aminopeptidase YwaD
MKRFLLAVLVTLAASAGASGWQSSPTLFTNLDPIVDALWAGFDSRQAQQHVEFISRYWRLAGNAGYDATLDRVQARLSAAGFTAAKDAAASRAITTARLFVDQYPNTESGGWDHTVGTLAIAGSRRQSGEVVPDDVVLSKEKDRLALCINSFSTPSEGLLLSLYDVGPGDRDQDYAGKNLKGAVVLGDADVGQLWRRAVVNGGAIGVISTSLPRYLSPDSPGARPTPRDEWDILQWGSIPYDATRKGFGFKASPRAAARLRRFQRSFSTDQEKKTPGILVRVTIASTFSSKPNRTLVAEIPGRVSPNERVILAAHVQEPGANDNATGVATLAELAVALQAGIRAGKIPAPGRTLTFLFLNEIGGSRRWLQDHPEDAKSVRYMISMDMTGEDVAKTGGTFLVERWPDPGAVWERPWDPHSEWGRGNVKAEQLKGDLINDTHLAICERVARRSSWVVKSNPYEGGSDHTVFGSAGVPSVLDWHFTDRYYHTNFDTPDKTSPAEMRNVGVSAATTGWLFGSADSSLAMSVAELVADAGKTRIATEEREGAKLAASDKDPAAARTRETQIVAAWRKWYGEAVRSVTRLVVGQPSADFGARLEKLAAGFATSATGDEPAMVERVLVEPGGPFATDKPAPQANRGQPADVRLLTCGSDMTLPAAIPVRWDTVALAADSRGFAPCWLGKHTADHREWREREVLEAARRHRDPELRRMAARAIGQIGAPVLDITPVGPPVGVGGSRILVTDRLPGVLSGMLSDPVAAVRREAANAIGDLLSGVPRELVAIERPTPEGIAAGRSVLEARLKIEKDIGVSAEILATLGRLKYADDATRNEVETFLVAQATEPAERITGAAEGLEALIRGNPKRPVGARTRETLRMWTARGGLRTKIVALLALQQARDDDVETLVRASRDPESQVRRLVALRLDAARDEFTKIIDLLSTDTDFTVRYEMANVFARHAARTRECAPLLAYLDDREPTVVLRAIDLLPAACGDNEDTIARLTKWAEELKTPLSSQTWHVPAHALQALARLRPAAGRPLLGETAKHAIWQVRARAAASCEDFKDEAVAHELASDREPNVRTAALDALVRLQSEARFPAGIAALKSTDFQLLRTAAIALRGTPEALRTEAVNELFDTLRRLTEEAADTSRDPRVAILERLGELLPAERTAELGRYREDFDPKVREAATAALGKVIQTEPPEVTSGVKHRYPYQPVEEMRRLPRAAIITMQGGGTIEFELFVNEAPVTVARFSELARAGYYDGLTFHRVVPNFVIQGGSPGANEYAGAARYMRDEVGTVRHTQGAVGISTRGRDTGDAQIFIDLVDVPRLDHEYTVFARVVRGFDVVQRVLEGAKIASVKVK